ncbi:DUF29 domain-containing protein [Leptolyngbya sp. DQ-M1]
MTLHEIAAINAWVEQTFPIDCLYSLDSVLDEDWLPES